jgi:hypothetical protein
MPARTRSRMGCVMLAGAIGVFGVDSPAFAANCTGSIAGLWKMNANGVTGMLNIASVDSAGNLSGSFIAPIQGFWNQKEYKITFAGGPNPSPLNYFQVWTGYCFHTGGVNYLTGYYEAFTGTGGTPQRNVFGWFAYR